MRPLARLLRAVFGVILFAALAWVAGPRRLAQTLVAASPLLLLAGLVVYAALVAVKVARWRLVVALEGLSLGGREALRAYGLGMLLGAVTPGRIGQHVKALALVERGAPWPRALASTLVDQFLDMLVIAALLPPAVGYFGMRVTGSAWMGVLSLALAAIGLALLAAWSRGRFGEAAAAALRLGRRSLGLPLALAAASTLLYFVTLDLVARAVGMAIGPLAIALASVASAVVEMAPVTVAGLGTREAALLALLGPLGVAAPSVLAFTVIVRVLQVATGTAAYVGGRGRVGWRRAQERAEEGTTVASSERRE